MLTFALDTALQACSVAILRGRERVFEKFDLLEKGHAEVLPPMAASAFDAAGVRPRDLDRIIVSVGPGGFTGLRVGLAFARTLALGTKAEVIGVDTLRALHASHPSDVPTACVVDARRGEVFAAAFNEAGTEILAPFAASPEDALERLRLRTGEAPLRLIGNGAALLRSLPSDWSAELRGAQISPTALAELGQRLSPTSAPPDPIYLRAPDAKKSAKPLFAGLPEL